MLKVSMISKERLPLLIGIGLPVLLIAYVFLSIHLPSLFVKPQYNFLYTSGYTYDYELAVIDDKLTLRQRYYNYNDPNRNVLPPPGPIVFLYDVSADKTSAMTLSQAQQYTIDPSNKSPDGFSVGRSTSDDYFVFPFFFGGGDRGIYLMGKGLYRKITTDQEYDFKFLGWVTNE